MDDKEYRILSDRMEKIEDEVKKLDNEVDSLKLNNVKIETELTNLRLGVEQVKVMINESAKDNQKLTLQLIEVIKNDKECDNKRAMTNTEKMWAAIIAIIGGVLAYLGLK